MRKLSLPHGFIKQTFAVHSRFSEEIDYRTKITDGLDAVEKDIF